MDKDNMVQMQKEMQAEESVLKENPELHNIVTLFKKFADEEEGEDNPPPPKVSTPKVVVPKETPVSVQRLVHRQSVLQAGFNDFSKERSLNTFLIQKQYMMKNFRNDGLDANRDENSKIYLTANMKKLNDMNQKWVTRFFVLRQTGLFYYDNEKAWEDGDKPPREKIFFMDVLRPRGQAAEKRSDNFFSQLFAKSFVFQVYTEQRTYSIDALSAERQLEWSKKINELYEEFVQEQDQRNGMLENAWMLGDLSSWQYFESLVKQSKSVAEVVDSVEDKLLKDYEDQIVHLQKMKLMRKTFEAWRLYSAVRKRNQKILEAHDEANQQNNDVTSIDEGPVIKFLKTLRGDLVRVFTPK